MPFDPTAIAQFIATIMTKELLFVAVCTFFTCYGIFMALEPKEGEERWADRYKVITSLVAGTAWGLIILPILLPETGYIMSGVLGFLAGGATTITVDQFKH